MGVGVEQGSDLVSSVVYGAARIAAWAVERGGVTVVFSKPRAHGFEDMRAQWRGGGVV